MDEIKRKAIDLRKKGLTFSLIQERLNTKIPKSTLSCWFREVKLSTESLIENKRLIALATEKSRTLAVTANKVIRQKYFDLIEKQYIHLEKKAKNTNIGLIILAMIYLGEGAKSSKGSLMIGNSDPNVIKLFLFHLRQCFEIDEKKFRCTVQCRDDQNILELEKYWVEVTDIPLPQFYKASIDPRTIGKPSRKPNYKGVCRLEYMSADIYHRLMKIAEILTRAHSSVG